MVKKYYQKCKEKSQKEALEIYQNLSKEEKDERIKKARERHQNFIEKEKESNYLVTLKILRQSSLFHGLILEKLVNSEIFLWV